jgi:phosphatidylglycerol:prolipoprotein diacylglycerol transferase
MIPYTAHTHVHFLVDFPPYMVLWWLGWLVGLYVWLKEAKRVSVDRKKIIKLFLIVLLSSVVVGRIIFFLGPWNYGMPWYYMFNLMYEGYSYYPMFFGGLIGLVVGSVLMKERVWKILDIFSLGIGSGLFFGRIGCFFAGCCYGKITSSFGFQIIGKDYMRYPTQTLSSIYNLLIFVYLSWFKYRKKFEGQVALLFFMIYSVFRFLVEFLREYDLYFYGLTASQWVSILIFVGSLLIYLRKRFKN